MRGRELVVTNLLTPSGMGIAAIALTFAHYFVDLFIDEHDAGFTFAKKIAASSAIGESRELAL